MISLPLLKREIKANYKLLLIFMAVLTLYASMIISMFDPQRGESLALMAQSMPQLFAAFGMQNPGATLLEFVCNYLYGFLLIVFPMVFILFLSNRLMARYIDKGSMAYLLATPNKRSKIVFTQAAVMLAGVAGLIAYVSVLCIGVSGTLFPGQLDIGKFIFVNVGLCGLHVFLSGMCFFFSCCFNETKLSTGVGAAFSIAFILLQMLSQAGDKFEALKYATPLTLFNPEGIAAGSRMGISGFCILYLAGLLLFGAGSIVFQKRDLPL